MSIARGFLEIFHHIGPIWRKGLKRHFYWSMWYPQKYSLSLFSYVQLIENRKNYSNGYIPRFNLGEWKTTTWRKSTLVTPTVQRISLQQPFCRCSVFTFPSGYDSCCIDSFLLIIVARENFINKDAAGSRLMLLRCTSAHLGRAGERHQRSHSAAIGKGH
jgi:hypothetical protein